MCFSAPVSFVASGILTTTGIATLKKIKSKKEIPVAIVPIFFAIQQFSEGILWLSNEGSLTNKIAAYFFMIFAYVIWPAYGPLAILLIENNKTRKKIIFILLIFGIFIALYLLFFVLIKNPLTTTIINNSIAYIQKIPYQKIVALIYLIAVCGSCFISSHRWIKFFGTAILTSFIIAAKFYEPTFGSIWCFFAAALSVFIYLPFKKREAKKEF